MDQSRQSGKPNKIVSLFNLLCHSCISFAAVCGILFRLALKLTVISYFIFCAIFLSLRYGILPNIDAYKTDIERIASHSIGRNLSISSISASWQGINPRLMLNNVVVLDQNGRSALVLPNVSATLSWWSVVAADLRFKKIEVIRPSLNIRRDAAGIIYVAGISIDTQKQANGTGLDWLLAQHEIEIRQGSLSWTDQLRSAPELVLANVNFILNNQWGHHKFALKAQPPLSLAAPVDVRGSFRHPAFTRSKSDFSSWTGELYADLRQADLSVLKVYFDYPADLQKGMGTIRSWTTFEKGRIADFTADVRLNDVLGKLRHDLPAFDMAQVSGRLIAAERAAFGAKYLPSLFGQGGHTISLVDFSMQTREGIWLPSMTIRESFIPGEKGRPQKVELYATVLDLQALADVAERLPLPLDQRQMLIDFAPQGQLKDFSAQWQGVYPEISAYHVKGQFINLAMKPQAAQIARPQTAKNPARPAVPAIPGFEQLSGSLDANDRGGSFVLNSNNLTLQFPGYFVNPLMPFDKLQMQARWQFESKERFVFQISKMDFQQDGMSASLSGKHVMTTLSPAAEQKNEVDISGKLTGFDLKQLDRYVPADTPTDLRHWLTTAILDGRADDVSVRVKGDLAQFPFNNIAGKLIGKSEFLVKGKLTGGKLDFEPGYLSEDGKSSLWPVIDNIKGSFVFDRARMEIRGDTAKTLTADLLKVKTVIPDLLSDNPILYIEGNAGAGLQTMLQYVKASPVNGWLEHFLEDSKATGNAQLQLKLQLPLNYFTDSKVQGVLHFANNEALLQPSIPLISGVNGKLDFNEKGVNLTGLKGSLLGGPVVASGGTQKDGSIRIRLDGTVTSDGLRKNFPGTVIAQLSDKIAGATRYNAQINVKKHQPELIIESSLQGLALNFPAPVKKLANEYLPVRFEMTPLASNNPSLWRDEIKLSLGAVISARYQRQKTDEKNAAWQMLRGGIGVNVAAPEPDSGLSANIDFRSLNVDEWRALMATESVTSTTALATVNQLGHAPTLDLSPYIEPNVLAVRTSELLVMGKKLDNVVVGASYQNGVWQANIDSSQTSGYLRWNESSNAQGAGNVTARLSRLIIPASAASDVSEIFEGKKTSAQIPGLDIVADNFELFNKKLGQLELLASNLPVATGREWRIKKISLKNEDAELKGTGKWSSRSGEGITDLSYVLDVENAGKLLDRFGFLSVMRGGRGKLEGDIRWNGLPYEMDIPSMTGKIQLDLAAGQFLKVDPGAAKLLGVLSMQSLPRRLTLDFRDVFSDGFAFDGINGTAYIQQGAARTDNLKMRSVNATVLMDGSADIAKETQDVHVAVIPEINAGTASVVYALAVNPVIGLGTFLAQLFLREPLARAFTYEYQITGPWKDPHVRKINNRENQAGKP